MLGADMSAHAPKLYVLPGSHPCAAVEEAMRRKAIDYERVDLLPLMPHLVGPLRYGGSTVPGMRVGTERDVPDDLPFIPEGSDAPLRWLARGSTPTAEEIDQTPRAASARLRAVERVHAVAA